MEKGCVILIPKRNQDGEMDLALFFKGFRKKTYILKGTFLISTVQMPQICKSGEPGFASLSQLEGGTLAVKLFSYLKKWGNII